jgi:photosystem II stability/assembly factor-like uncharacterized protein
MNRYSILIIITTFFSFNCIAQVNNTTESRIKSFENFRNNTTDLSSLSFINIGPSIMSGRVTDLSVNPNNTNEFYVAYASGSLWHTINNGQSFVPLFDKEATHTIGAIAVNWQENIIWIGTGEANSSRSSYAGTGIYKSIDSGKTWTHKGLEESHHIGKIIIDNQNKNIVYVAALGHLYSSNKERGFYKTTNGGDTWMQTLFINDTTGCIDICVDSKNKNIMFATTWSRTRTAWQFIGHGEGSGIYKSIDAGDTWKLISGGASGFPKNKNIGRIGISLCAAKPNVLYALVDNQNNMPEKAKKKNEPLKAMDIQKMSTEKFLSLSDSSIKKYLSDNGYPEKYNVAAVKDAIKSNIYTVKDFADWVLSDAGVSLFTTPVIGAELYRSINGGESWIKTHPENIEGLFFTYGYYFATVEAHPTMDSVAYLMGYTLIKTGDNGKTFTEIAKENCHADYHRLWINPANSKHIIAGNDGGINITYDEGNKWIKANNPPVGQFYTVTTDDAKPYNVYGGLQDNGTWYGPSNYTDNNSWHQDGEYAYKTIGGGDGMQVQVDTRDNKTMYTGYQFGYYERNKLGENNSNLNIHPTHDIGEKPLRFNWQTPIHLSKHNQDILYFGANYFFRSLTKGADLKKFGTDLTSTKKSGNVPYGTITTISESPLRFGLLYAGTDDGNIHISKDVGNSWEKINASNFPDKLWTSRIIASAFNEATAYVTFNGYRNDNFNAYVFSTNNYGKTWTNISNNIPPEPVNVIREDPKDSNILYVGTDNGLYVSFNKGKNYEACQGQLPRVPIHDLAIQSRENEMILATHGRSFYKTNLKYLQQLPNNRKLNLKLMPIEKTVFHSNWGSSWATYTEKNKPEIIISFYSKAAGNYTINICSAKGKIVETLNGKVVKGYNTVKYNAATNQKEKMHAGDDGKYYLSIGNYIATLTVTIGMKGTNETENLITKEIFTEKTDLIILAKKEN